MRKYSPILPNVHKDYTFFDRDDKGNLSIDSYGFGYYDHDPHEYDPDGYDWYGYSAYNADGTFAGDSMGVDRNGHTEMEYLGMSEEMFNRCTL